MYVPLQILSSYSPEEIQSAVGKRLVQNLSPWQLLCFQAEGHKGLQTHSSWQDRFQIVQGLLQECKEEFQMQTELLLGEESINYEQMMHKQNGSSFIDKPLRFPEEKEESGVVNFIGEQVTKLSAESSNTSDIDVEFNESESANGQSSTSDTPENISIKVQYLCLLCSC